MSSFYNQVSHSMLKLHPKWSEHACARGTSCPRTEQKDTNIDIVITDASVRLV